MWCAFEFVIVPQWLLRFLADFCGSAYVIVDRPYACLPMALPTDNSIDHWLFIWHIYWHTSPADALQVIWACDILWHFRSIFVYHIYFSVVWLIYGEFDWFLMNVCRNVSCICRLQYKCSGTHVQCGRHICSWEFSSNVECMHASGHGLIVHCIEFTWGRYTDTVFSYLHKK